MLIKTDANSLAIKLVDTFVAMAGAEAEAEAMGRLGAGGRHVGFI